MYSFSFSYTECGITIASFLNPFKDPKEIDATTWKTSKNIPPKNLDLENALFILSKLSSDFCNIRTQEEAVVIGYADKKSMVWKPITPGFQESCDVCETSLFNHHWICKTCGFSVCIDCYNERKLGQKRIFGKNTERDKYFWLLCENSKRHSLSKLILTQIIPNELLQQLAQEMHEVQQQWNIPYECSCPFGTASKTIVPKVLSENIIYETDKVEYIGSQRIIRLMNPFHVNNVKNFRHEWNQGRPITVSNLSDYLKTALWHPSKFLVSGGQKCSLINCKNGNEIPNQDINSFWNGFTDVNRRLRDEDHEPMILMLKDWPQHADFANLLPRHYDDFMRCLPLGDYTKRDGQLNLVNRLPDIFPIPELGPKMYNAYGSLNEKMGTTRLHLDISDAINVMVYVSVPENDQPTESLFEKAYGALEEAGCDNEIIVRLREKKELPGAVWHVFELRDVPKIRECLTDVSIQRGEKQNGSEPIHDQIWYLDSELRGYLKAKYLVEGHCIVQCVGECLLIPAGCPHQVKNIFNCMKLAIDFVSPENVSQCCHLTNEIRALPDSYLNHADKLQVKNIIFHSVKDAVSTLYQQNMEEGKSKFRETASIPFDICPPSKDHFLSSTLNLCDNEKIKSKYSKTEKREKVTKKYQLRSGKELSSFFEQERNILLKFQNISTKRKN